MTPRQSQIDAYLRAIRAIADAIREAGRIPSGTLYAMLMSKIDLTTYERIIGHLTGAGVVASRNHELIWIGEPVNGPQS